MYFWPFQSQNDDYMILDTILLTYVLSGHYTYSISPLLRVTYTSYTARETKCLFDRDALWTSATAFCDPGVIEIEKVLGWLQRELKKSDTHSA